MNYTVNGVSYEDTPLAREPANPNCRHCKTREIIQDGYEGWVHADDYKYQCQPGTKGSSIAEPGRSTGHAKAHSRQ